MKSIHDKYQHIADFINIYITDAHPIDEWALYVPICHTQPKTIEERIALAKQLVSDMGPFAVDLMDNNSELAYSAWPERHYIIYKGKIDYRQVAGTP